MRKRTKTKKISRLALQILRHIEFAALAVALVAAAALSLAQQAKKPAKKQTPYGVIAGTVFRDPGFAQAGAAVTLTLKGDPKEKKRQEAVSDNRGEFAFHVPPAQATYVIRATLKGFRAASQDIDISGEEQINATLLLVPESK